MAAGAERVDAHVADGPPVRAWPPSGRWRLVTAGSQRYPDPAARWLHR
jgi:hypothetical protein